jgi:cyclopropane fatty-acyl-phospholipid synthase-like methyltransferase
MSWDNFFDDYVHHNLFIKSLVYKSTIQLMRRVLRPGDTIIELGSGSGRPAMLMADMGFRTVALDKSLPLLKRFKPAAEFLGGLKAVNGDMMHLPFRDKSFRLAYSCEVLEHFDPDTVTAFLSEQRRVADFVVADVPNEKYRKKTYGDENFYNNGQWTEMFENAGLTVVKSFARGMDNGTFVGNCTVFLGVDTATGAVPEERIDVYDHY